MLVFTNNVISFYIENETICNMIHMYLTSQIYRNAYDYIIKKLILSIQKNLQTPVLNLENENKLVIFILNLIYTNIYTFNDLCNHLQLIINKITELVYGVDYKVYLKITQKSINNFNNLIEFPNPPISPISFPNPVKSPIILPYSNLVIQPKIEAIEHNIENKQIKSSIFNNISLNEYTLLISWITNRLIYVINNDNILTTDITLNLYNEIIKIKPTINYTKFDSILRQNNFDSINHMIEIYTKLNENDNENNIEKNNIIIG